MPVTIEYIARIANVSKATVSRVINGKAEGVGEQTRQKIQRIIDEHEYRPNLLARGIATSRTKTLGLIIPDITNPFFPTLVKSIELHVSSKGYMVILCNTNFDAQKENEYVSTIIANRVDGVFLTSTQSEGAQLTGMLKKYNIPCVLIDRQINDNEYAAGVFADNEFAVFEVCEYLIANGHKRIAYISGPVELSTSRERIEGYKAALKQYKIAYDSNLTINGKFTMESGYDAVMELESKNIGFTSIMAANDTMAIGALKALKTLGKKVPQDVEVIGFDNIAFAEMTDPPLTTVSQPVADMGKAAAEMLLNLIEGKQPEQRYLRFNPKLIFRSTTKTNTGRGGCEDA